MHFDNSSFVKVTAAAMKYRNDSEGFETAERSQAVYSSNWKEDILLEKQLQVLDRSQKAFIHRITVEQKMLYRRFQMKLHRSRLAYAQMRGNKEKVRELRAKHMHGLNTNCGNTDEDLEFLKKLRQRPCVESHKTKTARSRQHNDLSDKDMDVLIHAVFNEQTAVTKRSRSVDYQTKSRNRPESAGSDQRKYFSTRPATATGSLVADEYLVLPNIEGETIDDKIYTYMENISLENNTSKPLTSSTTPDEERTRVSFPRARPFTAAFGLGNDKESLKERVKSAQANTRKGRDVLKQGSLFEDHCKPNIVEQCLNEVKFVNYETKVKEFCESLVPYRNKDLNRISDYYTFRSENPPGGRNNVVSLPGTPTEENERHLGNTSVKSLTMPLVNFNVKSEFNDKLQYVQYSSAVDLDVDSESEISDN